MGSDFVIYDFDLTNFFSSLEFVVVIWKGGTLTFNLDIAKILVTLDAVEIRIIFQLKRNANKLVDRIPIKSVPIINPIIGAKTMVGTIQKKILI